MKVSVIVPVYNCAPYLPECIASLREQTMEDIELIFVDDASTDGSLTLLRRAQAQDVRVRVIAFPENRGVSCARNAGLDAATGEFVGFCDADDWVERGMFARLYDAARAADADAAFCRVIKERASGAENVPLGFDTGARFDEAAIRDTLIPAMLARETDSDELPLSGYTPRNLFARRALEGVRFRPDIRYAEDLLFICEAMLRCRAAVAVDEAYYHYRFHDGSVTKRYSPHVPGSHDLSNDALEALLAPYPACMARIPIRRRKMAVTAVRNCCLSGTPYGLAARVRWIRNYMKRGDVRAWFAPVRPSRYPLRQGLKLALMKYRMATVSALLYSYLFDRF